jgi:hypothetical protein
VAAAALVTFTHGVLFHWKVTLTAVPFSIIGLALAICLGFRNDVAYDRWWPSTTSWIDARYGLAETVGPRSPPARDRTVIARGIGKP